MKNISREASRVARFVAPIAAAALMLTACSAPSAPETSGDLVPYELGIGTLATSNWQQAFRYYDEEEQLINKIGRDFGYDITVKWSEFPVAPDMFAAMESGGIQIGPAATFPLVNQISQGKKYHILTNSLGMFQFMLMVPKDGDIKTAEDLRGKTVGLALGTAHQGVFENFIEAELGETVQEAGITLASQPAPVPRMPPGLDAYQTFSPAILPALEDPDSDIEPLFTLSAPAATGPAYEGPLGEGGGIPLPSAEDSPWYPEGFIALRNMFVASDSLMQENPELAEVFIRAHQTAMQEFLNWDLSDVTDLYPTSSWDIMPREAYERQSLAQDLLYKYREGWVWLTQAEVDILIGESEQMVKLGVIEKPLTIEQARAVFEEGAALSKDAYEELGGYPTTDVFTDPDAEDFRGAPIWEVDWATYEPR